MLMHQYRLQLKLSIINIQIIFVRSCTYILHLFARAHIHYNVCSYTYTLHSLASAHTNVGYRDIPAINNAQICINTQITVSLAYFA